MPSSKWQPRAVMEPPGLSTWLERQLPGSVW